MLSTEPAPRRQQFHVAPAMQQPKSAVSTPLRWIFEKKKRKEKKRDKRIQSLTDNHIRYERSESAREQRIEAYKSDQ